MPYQVIDNSTLLDLVCECFGERNVNKNRHRLRTDWSVPLNFHRTRYTFIFIGNCFIRNFLHAENKCRKTIAASKDNVLTKRTLVSEDY